mmetsp:Transcript_9553/g.21299  ORF Transcript_9553/g.21299 Transcript_9553/m.21299 type:complete len:799 (+) Transcript_9553:133-2529(+)
MTLGGDQYAADDDGEVPEPLRWVYSEDDLRRDTEDSRLRITSAQSFNLAHREVLIRIQGMLAPPMERRDVAIAAEHAHRTLLNRADLPKHVTKAVPPPPPEEIAKLRSLVRTPEALYEIIERSREGTGSQEELTDALEAFQTLNPALSTWMTFGRPPRAIPAAPDHGSQDEASNPEDLDPLGKRCCALVVSKEFQRRQLRRDNFRRRRQEALSRDREVLEDRALQLDAADARRDRRLKADIEERRRKAFTAQQRRNEQQKVRRELLREKERVSEQFYAKFTKQLAASASESRGIPGDGSPDDDDSEAQVSPPSRPITGPSETAGVANEPIFRATLESFMEHTGTYERAEMLVAENDRRIEAHRHKILGTDGDRRYRGKGDNKKRVSSSPDILSLPNASKEHRGSRRGLSSVCAFFDGARSGSASPSPRGGPTPETSMHFQESAPSGEGTPAPTSPTTPAGHRMISTLPALSGSQSMLSGSPTLGRSMYSTASSPWRSASSLNFSGTHAQRRQKCLDHAAEVERRLHAKGLAKSKSLVGAKERRDQAEKERLARTAKHLEVWQQKKEESQTRKEKEWQGNQSDEDMKKEAELERRRAESRKRLEEDISSRANARLDAMRATQANYQALIQQQEDRVMAKIAKKEGQLANFSQRRLMENEQRATANNHEERAQAKLSVKRSYDEAHRSMTQSKLDWKVNRSAKALLHERSKGLERQRLLREAAASAGESPKATSKSSGFFPAKESTMAFHASGTDLTSHEPLPFKYEDSDEDIIIQELEKRGAKWLQELRTKPTPSSIWK